MVLAGGLPQDSSTGMFSGYGHCFTVQGSDLIAVFWSGSNYTFAVGVPMVTVSLYHWGPHGNGIIVPFGSPW